MQPYNTDKITGHIFIIKRIFHENISKKYESLKKTWTTWVKQIICQVIYKEQEYKDLRIRQPTITLVKLKQQN